MRHVAHFTSRSSPSPRAVLAVVSPRARLRDALVRGVRAPRRLPGEAAHCGRLPRSRRETSPRARAGPRPSVPPRRDDATRRHHVSHPRGRPLRLHPREGPPRRHRPRRPLFPPLPPGIPESYRPAGPGPDWLEVMSHMALRLTWVDPGFSMDVFLHDADPALIDASAARAPTSSSSSVSTTTLWRRDSPISSRRCPLVRRSDAAMRWTRSPAWCFSP